MIYNVRVIHVRCATDFGNTLYFGRDDDVGDTHLVAEGWYSDNRNSFLVATVLRPVWIPSEAPTSRSKTI